MPYYWLYCQSPCIIGGCNLLINLLRAMHIKTSPSVRDRYLNSCDTVLCLEQCRGIWYRIILKAPHRFLWHLKSAGNPALWENRHRTKIPSNSKRGFTKKHDFGRNYQIIIFWWTCRSVYFSHFLFIPPSKTAGENLPFVANLNTQVRLIHSKIL